MALEARRPKSVLYHSSCCASGGADHPSAFTEMVRQLRSGAAMRMLRAVLPLFLAACASAPKGSPAGEPADLAFTHVAIVDVQGERVLPDQTVLIAGNRIQIVGPSAGVRIPSGARAVDARGKYLIPGLVDTHVHRWWSAGEAKDTVPLFALLLAHGVTSMREASGVGREREFIQLREQVERGELIAPRLFVSGTVSIKNVERYGASSLSDLVRQLAEFGVDGIKVIHLTASETTEAIQEGQRLGLPVYGHTHVTGGAPMQRPDLPFGFQGYTSEAVAAVMSGIMHVTSLTPTPAHAQSPAPVESTREERAAYFDAWWAGVLSGWLDMREGETDELIRAMLRHGTWLEPTLIFDDVYAHPERYQDYPGEAFLGVSVEEWWGMRPMSAEQLRDRQQVMARLREFVRRFHEAGGLVLAGSDNSPIAGFGIHDELALLVESGLSPADALRAATINPAQAFGREDRLGTIKAGKLADLVLLDANPLEYIQNTRKISAVVMNGRYLDRQALDELLTKVERRVN